MSGPCETVLSAISAVSTLVAQWPQDLKEIKSPREVFDEKVRDVEAKIQKERDRIFDGAGFEEMRDALDRIQACGGQLKELELEFKNSANTKEGEKVYQQQLIALLKRHHIGVASAVNPFLEKECEEEVLPTLPKDQDKAESQPACSVAEPAVSGAMPKGKESVRTANNNNGKASEPGKTATTPQDGVAQDTAADNLQEARSTRVEENPLEAQAPEQPPQQEKTHSPPLPGHLRSPNPNSIEIPITPGSTVSEQATTEPLSSNEAG